MAQNRAKAEDLLEVEPLVCRVRVMVLRACLGVSTRCLTCLGVDLSKPEWLFGLFIQGILQYGDELGAVELAGIFQCCFSVFILL